MIRELVLQLKLGSVRPAYFREKYRPGHPRRFREPLDSLRAEGYLTPPTREQRRADARGLLRVDTLLPRFFRPSTGASATPRAVRLSVSPL